MKLTGVLVIVCAAVGAAAGGFAITSAYDSHSASPPDAADDEYQISSYEAEPLVPPARGPEPIVFTGGVESTATGTDQPAFKDERVTVFLTEGASTNEDCFRILVADETHTGCVAIADIRTGTTYIATQSHGGPIDVIGLVPDDANTVRIGGSHVDVHNNVWHYVGSAGENLGFEVISADGTQRAVRLN
jgi:hypothetical protein